MSLPNPRLTFLLVFLAVVFLLGAAFYLEFARGLEPCPLCISQRVMLLGVGLVSLVAFLHNPDTIGRRIYGLLVSLSAMGGLYFAGRQLWLQSLPADQVPACGPDLFFMLENMPLGRTVQLLLRGSGQCAEVHWRFLGLSIAGWSLVWFTALAAFTLWLAIRALRGKW